MNMFVFTHKPLFIMNNVLVLTDFSTKSRGAINYGISLFCDIPSTFTILNTQSMSAGVQNKNTLMYPARDFSGNAFEELLSEINHDFPFNKITFNTSLFSDSASVSVKSIIEKEHISIVIIGTKYNPDPYFSSSSNYYAWLCEYFNCVVLVVPENKNPSKPEKIIFAVDFKFNILQNHLKPLFYFARNLPTEIFLLQICSGKQSIDEAVTGLKVIHSFEDIPYSFHISNTKAAPQKIVKFNKIHKSVMLALILHTFKVLESAMEANYVTDMLFQNQVPLLLIPHS